MRRRRVYRTTIIYFLLLVGVAVLILFAIYKPPLLRMAKPTPAIAATAPDIRVLTANINLLRPNEGIHRWSIRRDVLVKVLHAINPDIIGMQASTPAQTAWLIPQLPVYSHFPDGAAIHSNLAATLAAPLSTWNQIWYRTSRFKRLAGTFGRVRPHHPQSNPTENTYFSLVVLEDRAGYFPDLIVLDVHLRHWETNAVVSAEKLHAILLQWQRRYPAARAILLGDMNHSRTDHAVYQALLGTAATVPLRDTFDYAQHKPGEQWGTWENYTHHVYSPWPTDLIFVAQES